MTDEKPAALVTGSSRRVGKAIVQKLAEAGFPVIVHANSSADEAEALAEAIRLDGGRAAAITADLSDIDATKNLISRAAEPFGKIALLVNNASIFEPDEIGALDEKLFDRHMALHVKAPAFLAEALAAQDLDKGLIVNMIDARVWRLTPRYFSYTLSKSALWTATRTMAQALAPKIRVNAIGPGPTLPHSRQTDAEFARQAGSLLLQRASDLGTFGQTIDYLWQAKSVTGQMIALDGGQHLAWETPDQSGGNV